MFSCTAFLVIHCGGSQKNGQSTLVNCSYPPRICLSGNLPSLISQHVCMRDGLCTGVLGLIEKCFLMCYIHTHIVPLMLVCCPLGGTSVGPHISTLKSWVNRANICHKVVQRNDPIKGVGISQKGLSSILPSPPWQMMGTSTNAITYSTELTYRRSVQGKYIWQEIVSFSTKLGLSLFNSVDFMGTYINLNLINIYIHTIFNHITPDPQS